VGKWGNVTGYVVVSQMMGHPRGGATKQEDKRGKVKQPWNE